MFALQDSGKTHISFEHLHIPSCTKTHLSIPLLAECRTHMKIMVADVKLDYKYKQNQSLNQLKIQEALANSACTQH